jgi:8-oxo-dGTP pyrophosphatase MutT (NUDIX family)
MDTIRISEFNSIDKKRKAITSAKAYIVRKREDGTLDLLLLQEKRPDGKEDYTIPGGSIENDEYLEETLEREITEETGYSDFEILNYIGTLTYELGRDTRWVKTDHLYLVQINSEQKSHQNMVEYEKTRIKEVVWVDIEKGFDLLTRYNQEEYIRMVRKFLNI